MTYLIVVTTGQLAVYMATGSCCPHVIARQQADYLFLEDRPHDEDDFSAI